MFSAAQRRFLATALTVFAAAGLFVLLTYGLGLMHGLVLRLEGALWPLAIAGVLALLLRPVIEVLERWRLPRLLAVAFIYSAAVIALALFILWLVPTVGSQGSRLAEAWPSLQQRATSLFTEVFPAAQKTMEEWLGQQAVHDFWQGVLQSLPSPAQILLPAWGGATSLVGSLFGVLAAVAIIPIYLFFFLLLRRDLLADLDRQLSFLPERVRTDAVYLLREFIGLVVTFFRGQLLIGVIAGVVYGTAFTLVGLQFGVLVGMIIGLLNLVPFLGMIIGLLIAVPLALVQEGGGPMFALMVVAIFVVYQFLEGNVIGPRIMGQSTGLHPIAIIISFFFWGNIIGGLAGVILAIPLTASLVAAWRLVKRNYLDRPARRPVASTPPEAPASATTAEVPRPSPAE